MHGVQLGNIFATRVRSNFGEKNYFSVNSDSNLIFPIDDQNVIHIIYPNINKSFDSSSLMLGKLATLILLLFVYHFYREDLFLVIR